MHVKALIADDHMFVRLGLRSILLKGSIDIVGEAGDGSELLSMIEQTACDVIITDLHMPAGELAGARLVKAVIRNRRNVPVIVLSGTASPAVLGRLWHAGVRGIVGKEDSDDQIIRAVLTVAGGGSYCSERLRNIFISRDILHPIGTTVLSPAERQVIELMASGCSLAEIGRVRETSPTTTARQKVDAFRKLGVRSTHEIYELLHEFPEVLAVPEFYVVGDGLTQPR